MVDYSLDILFVFIMVGVIFSSFICLVRLDVVSVWKVGGSMFRFSGFGFSVWCMVVWLNIGCLCSRCMV